MIAALSVVVLVIECVADDAQCAPWRWMVPRAAGAPACGEAILVLVQEDLLKKLGVELVGNLAVVSAEGLLIGDRPVSVFARRRRS
jgi:hypothetical protein